MNGRKMSVTIKGGRFFKDGNPVPTEFGDKDQIALLARAKEMTEEGFYPEIAIRKVIKMEFQCLCGAINEFDCDDEINIDDPDYLVKGNLHFCHNCNLRFKVITDEQNDLMLIISHPKKQQ